MEIILWVFMHQHAANNFNKSKHILRWKIEKITFFPVFWAKVFKVKILPTQNIVWALWGYVSRVFGIQHGLLKCFKCFSQKFWLLEYSYDAQKAHFENIFCRWKIAKITFFPFLEHKSSKWNFYKLITLYELFEGVLYESAWYSRDF